MARSDSINASTSFLTPPSNSASPKDRVTIPGLCYNKLGQCVKLAVAFCKGCLMVAYCSKTCQVKDRPRHRYLCKHVQPIEKNRCPQYEFPANRDLKETGFNTRLRPEHEKTLWGNIPAFDILKLETNEGVDCTENLAVLFQGAHDLRNVIATVNGLAETYQGELTIVINESDFDLQLRNILILILASKHQGTEFADFLTHLTYSASLPARTYTKFMTKTSEIFKECWAGIRQLKHLYPLNDNITRTWMNEFNNGSSKVSVALYQPQWVRLATFLAPNALETMKTAEGKRYKANCPVEPNYRTPHEAERKKADAAMPRFQQITHWKYLETGLLMPFDEYYKLEQGPDRVPNPTFFAVDRKLMLDPFASPIDSFDLVRLSETCVRLNLPPNDLHGAVYYATREMYQEFCTRLRNRPIRIIMSSFLLKGEVIEMLRKQPPPKRKSSCKSWCFDRIFSAEWIGERSFYLRKTIHIFFSFLSDSPHASISALLAKATDSSYAVFQSNKKALPKGGIPERSRDTLIKLLPFKWYVYSGDYVKFASEKNIDGGWAELVTHYLREMGELEESLWENYVEVVLKEETRNFEEQTLREYLKSKGLRLVWEDEMTIAEAWPFRMKKLGVGSGNTQERRFQQYFGGMMTGSERFVEIKRI